jgi:hypothetical protein
MMEFILIAHFHIQENGVSTGSLEFFSLPNPSSCTMALRSTRPLAEMSIRNIPGGKGWPMHKADNLAAIYEAIV